MKSKAVAVAALCLAACGNSDAYAPIEGVIHEPCAPLVIVAAEGATAPQLEGVDRAASLWNIYGFTQLTTEGSAGEAITVTFQDAAGLFHGFYDPDTGDVWINNDVRDPGELGVVLAHELGHAMGLPHVPPSERVSVMNPGNLATPPSIEDNALLSRRCTR